MKKYLSYILILIILAGYFGSLSMTFASKEKPNENCTYASNDLDKPTNSPCVPAYKLLAPLPGLDNTKPFYPSDQSALGTYLNLIIKLIIGISAVLAVLMIVMGGIEYMGSELISSKEAGKDKIQNALLGLLIALGSWALLNTINGDLLNSDINLPEANVVVNIGDSVPQTYNPTTGLYPNGQLKGTPLFGSPTPLPIGVTLNNNGKQCAQIGEKGCTSTIGLKMDYVWSIKQGCPQCELVITGGTEWWEHGGQSGSTSHQNGSATVDLRTDNDPNSPLNKYLSGGKPLVKYTRYGPGNLYYYEGNHWHIGP